MSHGILAVIVIYGLAPQDSPSLRSLLRCGRGVWPIRIIVWDNSPQAQRMDPLAVGHAVDYVSTPTNLGLSTIYNRVIARHLRRGEHLLLLDQDTSLPVDYLDKAARAIAENPGVNLLLPLVRAQDRWASPTHYLCGWGWQWSPSMTGRMASRGVCAINSGMLISANYLLGDFPGYDERLSFYGTDTQFMLDYMDRCPELLVLDVVVDHDLSFFSEPGEKRTEKFFRMRSAYDVIYEKRPLAQKLGVRLVMLLVSIRYAIRYRSAGFLRSVHR